MTEVAVLILHPEAPPRSGEIERWVAAARATLAERHRLGFLAAGASDVSLVTGPPAGEAFGARVRAFLARRRPGGLVVLGSGAIPLATARDRRDLVLAAAAGTPSALANNRFSADVVAVACAKGLMDLPGLSDLPTDNVLPRWLAEVGGYTVTDLRSRWRLGFDIDGPLDLILLRDGGLSRPPVGVADVVVDRLRRVGAVARDRSKEVLIAGRLSADALRWVERSVPARTRALVEERGFRTAPLEQRPPRSILGTVLDDRGPAAFGAVLAELGDAAIIDTRVLLAHAAGRAERRWPPASDRFASDLLLPDAIHDAWLGELVRSAVDAPLPVLLGGHTLVGPGLRLVLRPSGRRWI
jgi:hypothetical protein